MLDAVWWLLSQIFGIAWAVAAWVLGTAFWFGFWVLLPFAVALFIAMRVAEAVLGKVPVRTWVKAHALRFSGLAGRRVQRGLLTVGVVPLRVAALFVVYALWHSLISLLWTPKWRPWPRAWKQRKRKRPIA